jgi:hypothetical protein
MEKWNARKSPSPSSSPLSPSTTSSTSSTSSSTSSSKYKSEINYWSRKEQGIVISPPPIHSSKSPTERLSPPASDLKYSYLDEFIIIIIIIILKHVFLGIVILSNQIQKLHLNY